VADTGIVALIEGGADDGVRARADTGLAGVALRAGAPVVAARAVLLVGVRAGAIRRGAHPGNVALIGRGADDGVCTRADAGLAGVALGAAVAVGAGGAVGLLGMGAGAVGRVTGAGIVALIEGGADDRVGARAHARLAGVGLGAGVAVVAGRAV